MNRSTLPAIAFFSLLVVVSVLGFIHVADAGTAAPGVVIFENPLKADSFQELLDRVLNILIVFGTSLYVLVIFIAALIYITSGANPQKRATAKNMLIFSTIGFFILITGRVLFFAMTSFIL